MPSSVHLRRRSLATLLAAGSTALLIACGGGGDDGDDGMPTEPGPGPGGVPVSVTLTPGNASIAAGTTQQFTAAVTGTTNGAVTWSSTAPSTATVSSTGLVTGLVAGITTIRACSVADPTRCAQSALQVTAGSGTAATILTRGVPVTGIAGAEDSEQLYRISVPAGVTQLDVQTTGGSGDVDLYVRRGQAPSSTGVDCASEDVATVERCTIDAPAAGDWYVLLVGFEPYSGVTLTATASTASASAVSFSFGEPTMTVAQAGQRLQLVTVNRNGYTGVIDLEVEPITDQFVEVQLSETSLAPSQDGFGLNVTLSNNHGGESFPIRVHAKIAGREDVIGTVTVNVQTRFTYTGGFTALQWEMYTISSAGDRCEYFVSATGNVTVSFNGLNQGGMMTTRIQGTLTSTAKQGSVGSTNCNSGTSSFDVTDDAPTIYPFLGGRVDRQFTSWRIEFYPNAMFGEAGSGGGGLGDIRIHIAGTDDAGIIGEQPAPLPLLLLPQ